MRTDLVKDLAYYAAEQFGYSNPEFLDNGAYGSVFAVSDDKVLKITEEDSDAFTCARLRKKPWTKHIINVYDVRKSENYKVYFILMDRVEPEFIKIPYSSDLDYLKKTINTLNSEFRNSDIRLSKYVDNANFIDQMIELYKELKKYKITESFDLHGRNLGWKTEDGEKILVFFDLDSIGSSYDQPIKVKKLEDLKILKEDSYFNDVDYSAGPPLVNRPPGDPSNSILAAGASDGRIGGEFYGDDNPSSVPTAFRYKYRIIKPMKRNSKKKIKTMKRIRDLDVRKFADWRQDS